MHTKSNLIAYKFKNECIQISKYMHTNKKGYRTNKETPPIEATNESRFHRKSIRSTLNGQADAASIFSQLSSPRKRKAK